MKKYTNALVRGKQVEIAITKDRYGRTVAMVFVDGTSLNQSLIGPGYAGVYRRYCRMDVCDSWYQDENKATPVKDYGVPQPDSLEWRKAKRTRNDTPSANL